MLSQQFEAALVNALQSMYDVTTYSNDKIHKTLKICFTLKMH